MVGRDQVGVIERGLTLFSGLVLLRRCGRSISIGSVSLGLGISTPLSRPTADVLLNRPHAGRLSLASNLEGKTLDLSQAIKVEGAVSPPENPQNLQVVPIQPNRPIDPLQATPPPRTSNDQPKLDPRVEPRIDLNIDPTRNPIKPNPSLESDPDLGILRPAPKTRPSPLPQPTSPEFDHELGILKKIRPAPPKPRRPPATPRSKSLYLLGRLDYVQNTNVFASAPLLGDGSLRSGLTLYYAPALGPRTYILATAEANVLRYGTISRLNYDESRFKVGLYHQFTPRVSGEIGWSYQQLTAAKEGLLSLYQGGRFFNEHSFRLDLTRQDPLSNQIKLVTGYQFRWNLTGDIDRYDRFIHSGFISLSYKLSPRMQAGIDYQGTWTHFLQQSRDDVSHYLGARLNYNFNDRISLNAFGGRSMGTSTDIRLQPESWIFGVGLGFNVALF